MCLCRMEPCLNINHSLLPMPYRASFFALSNCNLENIEAANGLTYYLLSVMNMFVCYFIIQLTVALAKVLQCIGAAHIIQHELIHLIFIFLCHFTFKDVISLVHLWCCSSLYLITLDVECAQLLGLIVTAVPYIIDSCAWIVHVF